MGWRVTAIEGKRLGPQRRVGVIGLANGCEEGFGHATNFSFHGLAPLAL